MKTLRELRRMPLNGDNGLYVERSHWTRTSTLTGSKMGRYRVNRYLDRVEKVIEEKR